MKIEVDIVRLCREIDRLSTHSSSPPPAVTRIVFSTEDQAARAMVCELFAEAGLEVRVDPVGNTFARWRGSSPTRKPVATGSHIDAIPNAGRFDGVVGVLGAIEAVRALKASGYQPVAPLEIILFTSEEPTRFGLGCLGSRLLSGSLSAELAASLEEPGGSSLEDLRAGAGFEGALTDVALPEGSYEAFVELHIEQGRVLESTGVAIGVVEKIAAPAAMRVRFRGEGGHAGAVLMPGRRDALVGGAELAVAVEEAVLTHGTEDGVATTGVFRIEPDAINSVPCLATLEIDIRDTSLDARNQVAEIITTTAQEIAARRGLELELTPINSDPPARCDARVIHTIESAAEEAGFRSTHLVSRAYHDTLFMARLAPVGMIFIPCLGGYSHRPDEYSSPEAIACGVETLARTLANLAA